MEEREFEQTLERLMKLDLSQGTDEFRDALLARCREVLAAQDEGAPNSIPAGEGITLLDDDQLDMLAAAGNPIPPHDDL